MNTSMESEPWVWEDALKEHSLAAPVNVIRHAPLSDMWKWLSMKGTVGEVRLAEVPNLVSEDDHVDLEKEPNLMWPVEVVGGAGYYVKIRFMGYPEGDERVDKNQYWVHFKILKVLNYGANNGLVGVPPWPIDNNSAVEVLTRLVNGQVGKLGASPIIQPLVDRSLKTRWKVGQPVETLDKDCVSRMRFGYVGKTMGQRVFVRYWDPPFGKNSDGYWVHADSDQLKLPGWSAAVGMPISAPKMNEKRIALTEEELGVPPPAHFEIERLMIFEMVNPVQKNELVVGQVTAVTKRGFFKATIISPVSEDDLKTYANGKNEFYFHATSPVIFPIGTARQFGLESDLRKPIQPTEFCKPLPIPPKKLEDQPKFCQGMYVEVVDSNVTDLMCPARILKILGPYAVRIRFIGWSLDYDQWKPLDSLDIFPVGWCEFVGHPLTPAGTMDEEESEFQIEEVCGLPPSNTAPVTSPSESFEKLKNRRKSTPKKLVQEVRVDDEAPPLKKITTIKPSNAPMKRKSSSLRKVKKESSESDDDPLRAFPGKLKKSGSKKSITLITPPRMAPEKADSKSVRRSSRSRAAPEFFGENIQRRNSRTKYLE